MTLPATHLKALGWLHAHGGEGVIDRFGRIMAQGDTYGSSETCAVWLRLVATEHVEGAGPSRIKLTLKGDYEAPKIPNCRGVADSLGQRHSAPLMIDDDPGDFA